jgi:D-sedoheptulose 7-phosphate isomerase
VDKVAPIANDLIELSRLAAEAAEWLPPVLEKAAALILESFRSGGKVLACGNGGSASDAQHFTGEIVGRFMKERPGLPAITLTVDSAVLTSVGNDYGFDHIFARQVEALGRPGDVLAAWSTSGKSPNVVKAIEVAQARGMKTIVFAGANTNPVLDGCDVVLHVPSTCTPRIQEIHATAMHGLCKLVEEGMFPAEPI